MSSVHADRASPPGPVFVGGGIAAVLLGSNYVLILMLSSHDESFRGLWRRVGVAQFVTLSGAVWYVGVVCAHLGWLWINPRADGVMRRGFPRPAWRGAQK